MVEAIAIGAAASALTGLVVLYVNRKRSGNAEPAKPDPTALILRAIEDLKTTSERPEEAEGSLLQRVEELERRMETVHKDSLRYLQKAAAAEQRTRQMRGWEEDEDGGMSPEEARKLLDQEGEESRSSGRPLTVAEIEQMGGE